MRIELRDGQWAELRERISHAADKRIKRAFIRGQGDENVVESQTVMVREFLRTFHILDVDGQIIPVDAEDAVDRLPDDIADQLLGEATDLYKGTNSPNLPTPPSSGGSSSGTPSPTQP